MKSILKAVGLGIIIDIAYEFILGVFIVVFGLSNGTNLALVDKVSSIVNRLMFLGFFIIPIICVIISIYNSNKIPKPPSNEHP